MEPVNKEARVTPFNPALLTDLYELTMAAVYFREKMFQPATFSLFIREYPADRGYFVNAGLETVLDYLEGFRFGPADIDYLRSTGRFADDFLDYLATLRFTGDLHAMAEGEVFFKDAPVLEITAPIIQAQLAESFVFFWVKAMRSAPLCGSFPMMPSCSSTPMTSCTGRKRPSRSPRRWRSRAGACAGSDWTAAT